MSSIAIYLFLVSCTPDLLVCETKPAEHMQYASMETCEEDVSQLLSRIGNVEGPDVWMAKCAYGMTSSDPRRVHRHRVFDKRPVRTAKVSR